MAAISLTSDVLTSALPDTSSPRTLPGMHSAAEIIRDRFGIPHVKAASSWDAFFVQGFVTAQDRLWHMELDKHRAYGRWAEFAGPPGLEQDLMMRRFRLGESAQADYNAIDQPSRIMLEAYSAGVNAFISTTTALPVEYTLIGAAPEPWQPWDSLAVLKLRHIFMGTFESKIWRAKLVNHLGPEKAAALLPGYQKGQPLILPPGAEYLGDQSNVLEELSKAADAAQWIQEHDAGSNNWVVSGSRTASGKPLLAGDPHRALDTPNVYYQNHISCPDFDVIGLSFPGVPGFPHFGHNRHVAWCVTHTGADYQDLFVERFKEGNPTKYEFKGRWLDAEVHKETIRIRGADPVEINVTVTHHGPVIAGDPSQGNAISFCYSATAGPNNAADVLLGMLTSRSTDELQEAVRAWVDPCNNFLFADVHGNIGYRTRGRLPVRSPANAWLPVPGWTGEHEWTGTVPFEEMPHLTNPEQGYIVTANNRVIDNSYPHYIALDFAPGFRASRLQDRLLLIDKATVDDMASVHSEKTSIPGQAFAKLLVDVPTQDELSSQARDVLIGWDGVVHRDGAAPTIYNALRDNLVKLVLQPYLGPLAGDAFDTLGRGGPAHIGRLKSRFHTMIEDDDRSLLPPGTDWQSLMSTALAQAAKQLEEKLGPDVEGWRWSKLHRTKPRHPLSVLFPESAKVLDPPSFTMDGDADTPLAASYAMAEPFTVMGMSVARYVFDLSDWDNSRWIVPLGSSGHPGSPHYADQAGIWANVDLIPMLYDWTRLEQQAESLQELKPA